MGCRGSKLLNRTKIELKNDDECQNLQVSTESQESSAHQDTINPRELKNGLEEEKEDLHLSEGLVESKNDDQCQNLKVLCSTKSQASSAHQDTINPREMKSGLEEEEEEEESRTPFSSFNTVNQWPQVLEIEEIEETGVLFKYRSFSSSDDEEESNKKRFSSLKKSDSGVFVKNDMHFIRNGARLLQELITTTHGKNNPIPIFSLEEVEKATNNFNPDRIVGTGVSCVYKGIIEDRHVAVKKYNADGFFEMFVKNVVSLSLIKHRNVVKLLGWCLEFDSPILVYDLLPCGTLRQKICSTQFLWKERLRIATEVADVLAYMHLAFEVPITHGFVSSRSVLLNEFDSARLCTFGFSTVQKKPMNPDNESNLRNTTAKCRDVHFFGMMMVELLTDNMLTEERHLITNEEIPNSLDKNLCAKDMLQIKACSDLAVRCVSFGLYEKPSIKEIVKELRRIARFKHPNVENGDLLPTIESIVEELRTTDFPRFQSLSQQNQIPVIEL